MYELTNKRTVYPANSFLEPDKYICQIHKVPGTIWERFREREAGLRILHVIHVVPNQLFLKVSNKSQD